MVECLVDGCPNGWRSWYRFRSIEVARKVAFRRARDVEYRLLMAFLSGTNATINQSYILLWFIDVEIASNSLWKVKNGVVSVKKMAVITDKKSQECQFIVWLIVEFRWIKHHSIRRKMLVVTAVSCVSKGVVGEERRHFIVMVPVLVLRMRSNPFIHFE